MQHTEFNWRTDDGLQLFAQAWQPDEEPRAAIALVHGLGEHSGRYTHVASALTAAGYALVAFDHRGHGRSEGQRGHSPSWETLLDDIDTLLRETASRFPGRPVFLYGHSFGGNLVLNYILRRKPQLAGAIVTAPILRTAFQPPAWKIKLGETLYNLWPAFSLSNELDPKGLSHDPQVASTYVNDPLVHNRISARLALDMLRNGEWAIAHAGELSLPLLLMHGAGDPVCSPQASQEFAQRAPREACTFKPWDNLYHEIHNEPEQDQVFDTIIQWLNGRLTA
jgi:alpha-beta hydrolase superfamily lysophospholipase